MILFRRLMVTCVMCIFTLLNLSSRTDAFSEAPWDAAKVDEAIGRADASTAIGESDSQPLAGTSLSAGDIAIIYLRTDTEDAFAFITFVDLTPGTAIYFTDLGVNSSGIFPTSFFGAEGLLKYTVGSGGLNAGDIIRWVNGNVPSEFSLQNQGPFTATKVINLSAGGDQMVVFQDASNPLGSSTAHSNAKFIFIAHTASTVFAGDPSDTNESHLPAGLSTSTNPKTALGLGAGAGTDVEWDNAIYSGTYSFTSIAEAKAAMTNVANYYQTNSSDNINSLTGLPDDPTFANHLSNLGSSIIIASSDTDPPTFDSAPAVGSVTTSGFTAGASIDEGGDIYYVVVADGATAPTVTNVLAGQASGGGGALAAGDGTNLAGTFTISSAVTGLSAGTAYDVYFVARDDESTPNVQASTTKVEVTTTAPVSLQIAATVLLEGAWNGANAMTTTLEDGDLISASAPYNGTNGHTGTETVANAASVPDGVVDWVLVEIREAGTAAAALNSTKVGSAAGFLMNDGSIKATDGTSNLTINLSGNTGISYYVVIYHRNHLPIMSATAISGSSGTLTIDFTIDSNNTYQTTTALVSLSGGKFGMPAGDIDQDGDIDAVDLGTWRMNNGISFSYGSSGASDFNLDGEINAVDRNHFHQKNTNKIRQVPGS